MDESTLTPGQKAVAINREGATYGTFAEIGGGQEVARWFFSVGGAAGTVAKTISAYDMAVSDALYGPARRYVSRQRLEAMLEHEYAQLLDRLGPSRGETKRFFAFANTVATRGHGHGGGRGWLGIRFQARPQEPPSSIIIHGHLLESTAVRQQEALGILGVNLIHGAFTRHAGATALIEGLVDELPRDRVEIDMIRLDGPAFAGVDNRLLSLQLVERGLTDAAMFTSNGEVVQPSEVLYKRPILVERGSFRPATKLTLDLLHRALDQFMLEPSVREQTPVVLAEMTLRSLSATHDAGHSDFLARADILDALGFDVLISRFEPYYQLTEYLAAYTDSLIGLAVGLPTVRQVADEKYYTHLPGGVLESVGRLFKRSVRMYVYPTRDPVSGEIHAVQDAPLEPPWHHLRALLLEIGRIVPIEHYDESLLSIRTPDVLARIQRGDTSWERMVPAQVAAMIKAKNLFAVAEALGRPASASG